MKTKKSPTKQKQKLMSSAPRRSARGLPDAPVRQVEESVEGKIDRINQQFAESRETTQAIREEVLSGLEILDGSDDDREASREPGVSGAETRYESAMAALLYQLKKRGSFRLAFQVIQEAYAKYYLNLGRVNQTTVFDGIYNLIYNSEGKNLSQQEIAALSKGGEKRGHNGRSLVTWLTETLKAFQKFPPDRTLSGLSADTELNKLSIEDRDYVIKTLDNLIEITRLTAAKKTSMVVKREKKQAGAVDQEAANNAVRQAINSGTAQHSLPASTDAVLVGDGSDDDSVVVESSGPSMPTSAEKSSGDRSYTKRFGGPAKKARVDQAHQGHAVHAMTALGNSFERAAKVGADSAEKLFRLEQEADKEKWQREEESRRLAHERCLATQAMELEKMRLQIELERLRSKN